MTVATRRAWDGGILVDFQTSGGVFDPAVDTGAVVTAPRGASMVATVVDSTTTSGPRSVPAVRTLAAPRLDYRITIGSKDVTWWRGVRTPLPTYGLQEPFLYGSGSLTLPQVHASLERPGHGDLAFLKKFAPVRVQRVDADGAVIATDYIGFISDFPPSGRNFTTTLGGQATGRAALADRPVPIFPVLTDIGTLVQGVVQNVLRLPVKNTPTTGIKLLNSGGGAELDFLTETLAMSTMKDGAQWTVMPNAAGKYRMFQKDTTTIAATVYPDGFRVVADLKRDFAEEPNRIWMELTDPDGRRIRFATFPGLVDPGESFFAGPYSPGDSGDDVTRIIWRLYQIGYLDVSPVGLSWTTDPDDPVTDAIEDLQDLAGLSVTGVVNSATWDKLFAGNPYSLRGSRINPAAQKKFTRAYLRDATGAVIGLNPDYQRAVPFVDAMISAKGTRVQGKKWAKHELADATVSNWVGTITVNTGAVIDGEHNPGDPLTSDLVRDARSIQPGMNLWAPTWDGGTLFHVSGANVSPGAVQFAVDTRARDAMKVWEVISRNRESRKTPDRQWIALNRRSGQRDDTGAFYDGSVFGKIPRTSCPADTWTVIATPAGRSGVLQLIDIQTDDAGALFGLSIWGKQVSGQWLDRQLGDPFSHPYQKRVERNTKAWQDDRWLVNVWGNKDQPCGYWPKSLDPTAFNVVSQTGASADSATDAITLSHHGYSNGDVVYFSAGSVPAGLTAGSDYYVIASTLNTFKVSASKGGSAMNITADHSGVTVSTHEADIPPVTGQYRDKSGVPYFCKGSPVLWIAVRPDRDCHVQGGRVLELLLDDSAG